MLNRLACLLAAAAAALAGPVAAQGTAAPRPAVPAAADPLPVLPRADRQEIRAQLTPRRHTTLAAEIGARIRSISAAEGERFVEGQTLVGFDCSIQEAQLDKARAELEAAEATFKANERMAALGATGGLDLDLSRIAVARSRSEVGTQQAWLSKCAVKAPFAGRVAEQKVREQQYVQPGQPMLDILDDSVLELEFLVPSHWLRWLKPGLPLRVVLDETRKTYPARFTRIGARVDPVSQSVKVVAAIDGTFPELVSGMSGRVLASPP